MGPVTGFDYLDARHGGPGQVAGVLAFAHRGGATHPDIAGLENTVHAFRHAHESSATPTSRPTCT